MAEDMKCLLCDFHQGLAEEWRKTGEFNVRGEYVTSLHTEWAKERDRCSEQEQQLLEMGTKLANAYAMVAQRDRSIEDLETSLHNARTIRDERLRESDRIIEELTEDCKNITAQRNRAQVAFSKASVERDDFEKKWKDSDNYAGSLERKLEEATARIDSSLTKAREMYDENLRLKKGLPTRCWNCHAIQGITKEKKDQLMYTCPNCGDEMYATAAHLHNCWRTAAVVFPIVSLSCPNCKAKLGVKSFLEHKCGKNKARHAWVGSSGVGTTGLPSYCFDCNREYSDPIHFQTGEMRS